MSEQAINLRVIKTFMNIIKCLFKDLQCNISRNVVIGFVVYAFVMLYVSQVIDRIVDSGGDYMAYVKLSMLLPYIIMVVILMIVFKNTFVSIARENIILKLDNYKVHKYIVASVMLIVAFSIIEWLAGDIIASIVFFCATFWFWCIPVILLERNNYVFSQTIRAIWKATYGYNLRIMAISFLITAITCLIYLIITIPVSYTVFLVVSTGGRDATTGLVIYWTYITNVLVGLVSGVIYARFSFVIYMIFRDRILKLLKEKPC